MGYACKLSGEYDNLIEAYSIGGNMQAHQITTNTYLMPRKPDAICYMTGTIDNAWRGATFYLILPDGTGKKITYQKAISNTDISYTYDENNHHLTFSTSPGDDCLIICLFNKKVKYANFYAQSGAQSTTKVISNVPSEPYAICGNAMSQNYMSIYFVYKDNKGNKYNLSPYSNVTRAGFKVDYTYNKETKELTVSGGVSSASYVGIGILY